MKIIRLVMLFSLVLLQACTIFKRRYTGGFYFENSASRISEPVSQGGNCSSGKQKKIQESTQLISSPKISETMVAGPIKRESGEIKKTVNEGEIKPAEKNRVTRGFKKFQPVSLHFKRSLLADSAGNKKLYMTVLGISLILIVLAIYAMNSVSTAALSILFLVAFLVGMIFFIGSALLLLLNYWNKTSESE